MPVVTKLLSGSEEQDFHRHSRDQQLGVKIPPIQFIPTKPPKASPQKDRTTIKIAFPSKVVKAYRVFTSCNLEHAINHAHLLESIVKDMRIKEMILATEAEVKEKQEELGLLKPILERARSTTPSSHRWFASGDSPESTEFLVPARMCSQVVWRPSRRLFLN